MLQPPSDAQHLSALEHLAGIVGSLIVPLPNAKLCFAVRLNQQRLPGQPRFVRVEAPALGIAPGEAIALTCQRRCGVLRARCGAVVPRPAGAAAWLQGCGRSGCPGCSSKPRLSGLFLAAPVVLAAPAAPTQQKLAAAQAVPTLKVSPAVPQIPRCPCTPGKPGYPGSLGSEENEENRRPSAGDNDALWRL